MQKMLRNDRGISTLLTVWMLILLLYLSFPGAIIRLILIVRWLVLAKLCRKSSFRHFYHRRKAACFYQVTATIMNTFGSRKKISWS